MKKFRTDYERLEIVKKYKCSGKTMSQFSIDEGIAYETLRDWVKAFNNLNGEYINLKKDLNSPGVMLRGNGTLVRALEKEEINAKSKHFSKFDHSLVVVEFKGIKITTSLEQAMKIMEQYYDRFGNN